MRDVVSLGLTGREKSPRVARVHARYSRRHLHDHLGQCSCPTHSFGRPNPTPPPPPRHPRGRPTFYSERLFLKALVIMIVRRLHKVGELLAVLQEGTQEVQEVRQLLSEG